jgi:hypothetical protein
MMTALQHGPGGRGATAGLTFSVRNALLATALSGQDVKRGDFPVTFVNSLSVVTAYLAFAFVGAIVLGMF